ncbi:hypothetical protein U1Q18_011589 [Sarracenia purpurea var. burkii]
MECVEGALKNSFVPEMAVKKTHHHHHQQQAFLDDVPAVNNGQSGVVSGDDFFVDDLLDFSEVGNEDGLSVAEEREEHERDTNSCCVSVSLHEPQKDNKDSDLNPTSLSVADDFRPLPCSDLTIPADDLADLEWLSHFVEDSFSNYSLTYSAAGKLPEKTTENRSETQDIPVPTKLCFTTPVQTKARSKRSRTGFRVWSLDSPSLTDSSSSSSSLSSSTTSSSPSNTWLIYTSQSQTAESLLGPPPLPPATKLKKKKHETSVGFGGGSQQPRRCSHCLVQKTPQWRTGPLGAKTLCNACGVRFKSGRLLPEYRPACSPTFSSDIHSNNHRKVLEMRRKKEGEPGFAPPVQSF